MRRPSAFYPSLLLASALTLGLCASAVAQTPPASVDPSRIPAPAPLAPRQPDGSALPRLDLPDDGTLPPDADKVHFHLNTVTLDGNSVFSTADFEAQIASLRDQDVSLTQVYGLTQAITRTYREKGYLLARVVVPPQDVTDGSLRLQVIEGSISGYTIQADSPSIETALKPLAEKLIATAPITSDALERYLLLMNDLPGLTVKSVLAPAVDKTGAANITLIATRKRVAAAAGVDTYGNAYLGPERVSGNVLVNGLVDARDSLTLSTLVAPDHSELRYGAVGYNRVVGSEGTVVGVSASQADTKPTLPPALGGLLRPEGTATSLGVTVQHPLIRSRQISLSLDGALEASRNETTYAPGLGNLETRDDQRVVGGGTTLTIADRWQGYNQLQFGFRKGLNIAGASEKGDAGLSRTLGDPEFFKLSTEMSRLQGLYGPFSLLLGLNGQWTDDSLLSSEQFGVGGARYGRGFDTSEITGDRGFAGKAELIWQPNLDRYFDSGGDFTFDGAAFLSNIQFYTFYDGGMTWNTQRTTGQGVRNSLTSTGVGSRFVMLDRLSGDVFFAVPLTNMVASRALDKQDDWRMQFSLRATLW